MFNLFKKTNSTKIDYVGMCKSCQSVFESEIQESVCPSCDQKSDEVYTRIHHLPYPHTIYSFVCHPCKVMVASGKENGECFRCKKILESNGKTFVCDGNLRWPGHWLKRLLP